jgi:hypothetical protein
MRSLPHGVGGGGGGGDDDGGGGGSHGAAVCVCACGWGGGWGLRTGPFFFPSLNVPTNSRPSAYFISP